MASSLILDEILQELEQDVSISRIKKVMYCACKGKWENDQSQIDRTNLKELVIELYDAHKSLHTLDELLSRIVSKINKKTEYGIVARKILNNLGKLYEEDDVTCLESATDLWQENPEEEQVVKIDATDNTLSQCRDPGYLFDTRQKIMQSVNPLKSKILIFSALEKQFNYSDRDFLSLRSYSLDGLLRKLFQVYENITDLEAKLYSTANEQEDPDENAQIAGVIIDSLTNAYQQAAGSFYASPPSSEPVPFLADDINHHTTDNSSDIDHLLSITSEAGTGINTLTGDRQEKNTVNDIFESGEITSLVKEIGDLSANDKNQDYLQNVGDLLPGVTENLAIPSVGNEYHTNWADDMEHEEVTVAMPIAPAPQSNISQPLVETVQSSDNKTAPSLSQSSATHLIKAIKNKFNLSEALKGLVENSVEQVMNVVERQFMDLEDNLNDLLINQNEEERLNLKYQALGDLIKNIQEISSKYLDILYQLELEERKGIQITQANPENSANTDINQSNEERAGLLLPGQDQPLKLAQQGNHKAIASMLNVFLNSQGINTVTGVKDSCLHIILESQTVPNQHLLVPVVAKEYRSWQISYWQKVKIHGRQVGSKSVTWSCPLE